MLPGRIQRFIDEDRDFAMVSLLIALILGIGAGLVIGDSLCGALTLTFTFAFLYRMWAWRDSMLLETVGLSLIAVLVVSWLILMVQRNQTAAMLIPSLNSALALGTLVSFFSPNFWKES